MGQTLSKNGVICTKLVRLTPWQCLNWSWIHFVVWNLEPPELGIWHHNHLLIDPYQNSQVPCLPLPLLKLFILSVDFFVPVLLAIGVILVNAACNCQCFRSVICLIFGKFMGHFVLHFHKTKTCTRHWRNSG